MSEEFGVAVLGTGWVAGEHIKAFARNPHARVMALLSRDHDRAETKAREHGLTGCRACTSLDEVQARQPVSTCSRAFASARS